MAEDAIPVSSSRWKSGLVMAVAIVLLSIPALVYARNCWRVLSFPYPLDYGEGPLLEQAIKLSRFENIYRNDLTSPPYTVANYPPLFMLVQAPFVAFFGPAFWYGRLISIVGMASSAVIVGLITHTLTTNKSASIIAALGLISIPFASSWSLLCRVDSLALALSLAGLLAIVRFPKCRFALTASVALLLAAIYTRQSYGLAAPVAGAVWLARQVSLRRAVFFLAALGIGGMALFLAINVATKGGFFLHIVKANINDYQIQQLQYYMKEFCKLAPIQIGGGIAYLIVCRRSSVGSTRFIAIYLLFAGLVALAIGKVGSNVNYFLELSAGMSMAFGGLVARFRRPIVRHAIVLLLAAQGIYLTIDYRGAFEHKLHQAPELGELMKIIEGIGESDGEILADDAMGMLVLAGKPIHIQPFEFKELKRAGLWDPQPFLDELKRRRFPLVLIYVDPESPNVFLERWMLDAIGIIKGGNYRVVGTIADTVVFKPQDTPRKFPISGS
jgi:hypothetical protein